MTINGEAYEGLVEPRKLLVDFIREDASLTGTHIGCEHGICGACTVLVDGHTVRSCLTFAVQAEGKQLWTVEGVAENGTLSPLQNAFWENHGLQCGFCTPGILMTAVELLRDNPTPSELQIREGIAGNLCRCTGYKNIIKSIAAAAEKYQAGEKEPIVAKAWRD
ncbi:MAG TPA: (2Fe-2S)-binding protein [Chloroflexota bacterium]|nr:(2Fe-2S)-binding protein [Chloroflexota bacterium]